MAQAPAVPAQYSDLYASLNDYISSFEKSVDSQWNGSKSGVLFSAEVLSVNANSGLQLLKGTTRQNYPIELDRLKAAGAQSVSLSLSFPILYQPFYAANGDPQDYDAMLALLKQVAADVRSRGLKLIVESWSIFPGYYSSNSGFNVSNYYSTLSLDQFTAARAQNAITILKELQPDVLALGSEPDNEASLTGQQSLNTPQGYQSFLTNLLSQIQSAGVRTVPIAAGIGTWMNNGPAFLQSLLAAGVDIVDFHVYPVNFSYLTNLGAYTDTVKAAGKQVGIGEAWLLKERDSELSQGRVAGDNTFFSRDAWSFWAPLDQRFLKTISDFANWKGLTYLSPFWSRYFWSYVDYAQTQSNDPGQLTQTSMAAAYTQLTGKGFTPTGLAYQSFAGGPGLVSGASFSFAYPAPGSIITIFDSRIASNYTVASDLLNLPGLLGPISATITPSGGSPMQAGLYFVSAGQVNAVLPYGLPPGNATFALTVNGNTIAQTDLTIVAVAPAIFTVSQNGEGAPAALVVHTSGGAQQVETAFQCGSTAASCAPKPITVNAAGDQVTLELFGTGIRNRSSLSNVTATVGSAGVPVSYAGPQSQYAGFDQVNVTLPASLAGSGTVPVVLTVDGMMSNTVTVQIQ